MNACRLDQLKRGRGWSSIGYNDGWGIRGSNVSYPKSDSKTPWKYTPFRITKRLFTKPRGGQMHLHDFAREFEKRAQNRGLVYELRPAATDAEIVAIQGRLAVKFHEQIVRFYSFCDGFDVAEPHFSVNSLRDLDYVSDYLIHLATIDHCHRLAFDVSQFNEAGQWFIVNAETGYRVTYTMASIWSNKVWAWVDWRRPVWREETIEDQPWSER